MTSEQISQLRRDYGIAGLSEDDAGHEPFELFRRWLNEAVQAELLDANAMILATASPKGIPSARAVLLKGLDARGFTFFTNYESRKGLEIAANPHVALVFPWHALERQVRIEGTAEVVSSEESDDYFVNRPIGSRLGAWASVQSAVIPDREYLERRNAELVAEYSDGIVPRPANWGGYRVIPSVIEFWQGRPSRLHDRIRFTHNANGSWTRDRLSP